MQLYPGWCTRLTWLCGFLHLELDIRSIFTNCY
uniref:Uncharacterized protein n=1 Tax=Arundo donax TaxID=35708 RepID=A0A0A8Z3W3_ARUDO